MEWTRRKMQPQEVAKLLGVSLDVLRKVRVYVDRNEAVVVIRVANPYRGPLPHKHKRSEVKKKSLREGVYQGLVGQKEPPDETDSEIASLKSLGYIYEYLGGYYLLKDRYNAEFYVGSDLDLQAVFKAVQPDRSLDDSPESPPTFVTIDTNSPEFANLVSELISDPFQRDKIQHGANENHVDAEGRPLRIPDPLERFIILDHTGDFYLAENLPALYEYQVRILGTDWIYGPVDEPTSTP